MADENYDYNDFESIMSEDLYNNDSMGGSIYESIIRNIHSSEMQKFIVKKLFYFYIFNKNLENILNNNIFNQNSLYKYETYYIIKPNWLWHFLSSYNYSKIFTIFEKHKTSNYSDEIIDEFHKIIIDRNIKDIFADADFEEEENIRNILKSEEEFFPIEKKNIFEDINFEFYDDSVILDKNTYEEIKEDRDFTHSFFLDPKLVELCLIKDQKFIYKIKNNIFGLGIIYNQPDKNYFYLFKVLIILIIDGNIDYKEQFKILLSEKTQKLVNHKKQNKNFNIEIIEVNTYYKKELNKEEMDEKESEYKNNKEEMDDEKESEYKNNKEENKNKMFNKIKIASIKKKIILMMKMFGMLIV